MKTLVFTADLPVPGSRYRDAHAGMSGPATWLRQRLQAVMHLYWALDVGVFGRQLDGAIPTARALPHVVDAVGHKLTVLANGSIRSGLDVIRMLALGARGVLLGRAYIYALETAGQHGVVNLLKLLASDMRVTMMLIGANSVHEITRECLALAEGELAAKSKVRKPFPDGQRTAG
jgi:isopentenyl diphosphate isomerase/L-lactate dehydrogenase-like FMN-dependent dehydrogenase